MVREDTLLSHFEKLSVETPKPVEAEVDSVVEGERLKERGNEAFKSKQYNEAIDWYTKAHGNCDIMKDLKILIYSLSEFRPTEPTYLTNRAACYMALKLFRSALTDCQNAAVLQSASPIPKTLVRLAKCHIALGAPNPALSAAREALGIDPLNAAAMEVERAARRLEVHLARVTQARTKKDWAMARLALEQAAKECDGTEPIEWQCWRIEFDLARGKLEQAMMTAKYVIWSNYGLFSIMNPINYSQAFQFEKKSPEVLCLRGLVMFLSGKLPSALQHAQQALTYDPEHKRARQLMRRIKDVGQLKDEGNILFKDGQLVNSVEKYTKALDAVGEREEEANGGAIRATLLSNRATALLKVRHSFINVL